MTNCLIFNKEGSFIVPPTFLAGKETETWTGLFFTGIGVNRVSAMLDASNIDPGYMYLFILSGITISSDRAVIVLPNPFAHAISEIIFTLFVIAFSSKIFLARKVYDYELLL